MTLLSGKTVWITGASSGIGEHLAYGFSSKGCHVILSARRAEQLQRVANQCSDASKSYIHAFDMGEVANLDTAYSEALKFTGQIDILVNNAGISQRASVSGDSVDLDRKIFEVNFFGNIRLARLVLPHMTERGSGNIVVISSIAGKVSTPFRSAYSASKHALHGWYDALRAEVSSRGVQVHMICPGYIKTNISINALNQQGEKHNVMDPGQDKGMDPTTCARRIIKAVESGKKEVLIGGKETKFVFIRNLFPRFYYKMAAKMASSKEY